MIKPQALDLYTLPLIGESLIEASAGTGKTYTLALLYLRLLLQIGGENAYSRPLLVEEILVVTFTEAATEELRYRIRQNIHALRLACIRGDSEQPALRDLLQQIADKEQAAILLLNAERQMDEAAIYTIHGFCQRMLKQNAFESALLFEQNLTEDETPLYRQVVADFWRRYYYPLPLSLAKIIRRYWQNPEAMLADIRPYLQGDLPKLLFSEESTLEERYQQIIELIVQIKRNWLGAQTEIEQLITASAVDKRSYSKSHLPRWVTKVTVWAESATEDDQLPDELTHFRQSCLAGKTKNGLPPQHELFTMIEQLYQQRSTIWDILFRQALLAVRTMVEQEKRHRAELGYDDLLSCLDKALQGKSGERLAQVIRQQYPVAMIDEFQDTDAQQYRIFSTLYAGRKDTGLLLIGDPKQAIYAFRGADIFTYMRAREQAKQYYTMTTNWRSSNTMVHAVNQLFQQVESPFLFEQIPFLPVQSAPNAEKLFFELDGKKQPALTLCCLSETGIGLQAYKLLMAQQCARQICQWLNAGKQQQAILNESTTSRFVTTADIAILVRDKNEAELMRNALQSLAIPSVYLSNHDSVFATDEAQELLWLLQSVLHPDNAQMLRTVLASRLFALTASELDKLNQQEKLWEQIVDEFSQYQTHWKRYGVLPMLQKVIHQRQLAEKLLAQPTGERRLTDILHISELLQEESLQQENEHALVRWLAQQIHQPNKQQDNQQLRLERDRDLVQIITIHKSKGLEYPIVCLPFICGVRSQRNEMKALYHEANTLGPVLVLNDDPQALEKAEQEKLAEELRLLYVAITRAVYHCYIGVAAVFQGNRRKTGNSDLHQSALGYLLQQAQPATAEQLLLFLTNLAQQNGIQLQTKASPEMAPWQGNEPLPTELAAKEFKRDLSHYWQMTSYSVLQQQDALNHRPIVTKIDETAFPLLDQALSMAYFDVDALDEQEATSSTEQLTAHTFPRGAATGTFLHHILEEWDFSRPLDPEWLKEKMLGFGLDMIWLPMLTEWLNLIVTIPLNEQGICLNKLKPTQQHAELQFYFPIRTPLYAQQLDLLMHKYDPLSAQCPAIQFQQVQGMLSGVIDLFFYTQGRYWLVDFKSNWLGDGNHAYDEESLKQGMSHHRYDLQYQLYTLALHRYLRQRLPDYDYQRDFGGVFYLFLRGIDGEKNNSGIFHCRPVVEFINQLDQLFLGE